MVREARNVPRLRSNGNVAVGEAFVRRLRDRCPKLAPFSATVSRPRPELRADIRSGPYGTYVIFFRYVSDPLRGREHR